MSAGLTEISEVDVIDKSHSSVHLDWSSSLNSYRFSIRNETDRIYSILQQIEGRYEDQTEWNDAYSGYAESKIIGNLQPKQQYKFRVRFLHSDDIYSAWSPPVQVITNRLTEITAVDVIHKTHTTVHLDWSSSLLQYKYSILNESERIYSIVQKTEMHGEDETEWSDAYTGYGANQIVGNLQPNQEYKFRVRFHRSDDTYSAWSTAVQVVTKREPTYGENLHKAIRNQSMGEIKTVLNSGTMIVDVRDNHGLTALMNTAKLGQTDIMEMLLSFNASVTAKDESGKTALMHACFHGQLPAVKLLIANGSRFDDFDLGGSSAIHYAVDSCNCELIEWIFKSGADVNCRDKGAGWTPLMRCASLTGNSVVAMLLIRNGANINLQDDDGKTCLMIAVINGHQKFVEVLLDNDADATIVNKCGRTAYDLAVSLEKRAIQKIMNPHDSDEMKENTGS